MSTPEGAAGGARAMTWKRLLWIATIVAIVGTLAIFIFAGFIPPLALFVVLWIVGLILFRAKEKAGAILLLLVHLVHFATSLPFALPVLRVPASIDFGLTLLVLVTSLVGLVAAVAVIAGRGDAVSSAPRAFGSTALVLFLAALAYSVYAAATYDSAQPQSGDVRLTTEDIEFTPSELHADEGTVSVFIENKDATLHTFTIEGDLDVDVDIPAGKSTHVTFEAEQGEYEFYCIPHEGDMEGTLLVE